MKKDGDICFINPMIRYCFDLPSHEDKSIYSYGFISRGLSDYLVVKIDSNEKYCSYSNFHNRNDDGTDDWNFAYSNMPWFFLLKVKVLKSKYDFRMV